MPGLAYFWLGGKGQGVAERGLDGLAIHDDNDYPFCLLGRSGFGYMNGTAFGCI